MFLASLLHDSEKGHDMYLHRKQKYMIICQLALRIYNRNSATPCFNQIHSVVFFLYHKGNTPYSTTLLMSHNTMLHVSVHTNHHQALLTTTVYHHHHRRRRHRLYSPGWALASSSKCSRRPLSWATACQFLQPSFFASSSTPSVHFDFGWPRPHNNL